VVEHQLTMKEVKVIKKLDTRLPQVKVDPNQMQQVVVNLLVNAADAMGEKGGAITLSSGLLRLSPRGIVPIRSALCRKGHDLMNADHKISGMASVRVKARYERENGYIMLDPVYGRNRHRFVLECPESADLNILCPECDTSLISDGERCGVCGGHTFSIEVPQQGEFKACARRGCSENNNSSGIWI